MRRALIALLALGVVLLGGVQAASMAFYGDLAQPPAVPAVVPLSVGTTLTASLGSRHAPALVRAAYARALLHRGDAALAGRIVAGLPDGVDAADLRGQIAERTGDRSSALEAYARAGDFERAQRLIETRVDLHEYRDAAQLEETLASALSGSGQAAVRARALWRLGQITQTQATIDVARSNALARRSLQWYEQALAIAPNEETYLLAAGQQALTLGDKPAARRYYLRALEAVPDSADARAGLARART